MGESQVWAALFVLGFVFFKNSATGDDGPVRSLADTASSGSSVPAEPSGPSVSSGPVEVRAGDGSTVEVDSSIAGQIQRLFDDASGDGVVLGGWGLRSHQRQHELRKINGCPDDGSWTHTEGEDVGGWEPASACRVPTARPGSSQHESGLAIDFTESAGKSLSEGSPGYRWLTENAATYGLVNLPGEPWHWSTTGR